MQLEGLATCSAAEESKSDEVAFDERRRLERRRWEAIDAKPTKTMMTAARSWKCARPSRGSELECGRLKMHGDSAVHPAFRN